MRINRIKNRGILFTYDEPGWDLNLYLIRGRKYNYLIDTGLGSLCIEPMKEYLKGKETIVINTHYHWDHIWGNGSFQEGIIVSHKLCKDMIQSKWDEMLQKNGNYRMGEILKGLPNLVFDKELIFTEDRIRLFHTPGHTIDSISVLDEEEKVLFAGDNVGDSEEDIVPSLYCDREVYEDTVNKYKELEFDICLSGHNTILKKEVWNNINESLAGSKRRD
ncbi:MBL fold metallo-hydrolase [Anaerocolumna xylanovorans]|uniref:Glyoxylase, beta-lactamase superfamily II n=1 Tax=Anaerocolumna xylanovorans DSM 12503 TaxID=1121345 RepID=A0A1M7YM02_9FIRM|nr:MBL fold metallo-hydrolase [Anaerocolumna xylanovorans]SHO53628.1 Glyoxylase, beta-lactamase superfamily II [Anaerocolumna xylanovorans DSM 12503]